MRGTSTLIMVRALHLARKEWEAGNPAAMSQALSHAYAFSPARYRDRLWRAITAYLRTRQELS